MTALIRETVAATLTGAGKRWRAAEGNDGLFRAVHSFVAAYADNAAMAGLWEEALQLEPPLAELRRTVSRRFARAVAWELRRAAVAGLVDPALEADLAARALTGMVDRFCAVTYVFDPPAAGPPPPADAARLLTRLWAGAIHAPDPPMRVPPP